MVVADGDGIPDGAEVKRVVKAAGPDGAEVTTTASWIHKRKAPVTHADAMGAMTPFERMEVTTGERSRDTGKKRRAAEIVAQYMGDPRERALDVQVGEANANRAAALEKQRLGSVVPALVKDDGDTIRAGMTQQTERAKLTESGRQFDAKNQPKIVKGSNGQEAVMSSTGQLLKLDPPASTAGARLVRHPDTNEVLGALNPDGTFSWRPVGEAKKPASGGDGGSLLSELDKVLPRASAK
jgi:hypothetical protein